MTALDTLRGHRLVPSPGVLGNWPDLYSTESTPAPAKLIHAHFFIGSFDWWLAELGHDDHRTAFGFVNLGDPRNAEWGYFNLTELSEVNARHPSGIRLLVERDLHWTPRPFADVWQATK